MFGTEKIDTHCLYEWINHFELIISDGENKIDGIYNNVLNNTIDTLKCLPPDLIQEHGWYAIERFLPKLFIERFVKYKGYGIRVANYFECFLECADIDSKKKLIEGFPAEGIRTGSVVFYQDENAIGIIGQKSDLIWSVYYNFFISEDESGSIEHTLSQHEDVLSLQIWNLSNDAELIEPLIDKLLLGAAMIHGLKFNVIYPSELWKMRGIANEYKVIVDSSDYEEIPASYICFGLNCKNSRMAYLHLYQCIEYFFIRAQNTYFRDEYLSLCNNDICLLTDRNLRKLIRKYNKTDREIDTLRLVVKAAIDPNWLRQYIGNNSALITLYSNNQFGEDRIILKQQDSDSSLLSHLSSRIYYFRCAIAHAKGDTDEFIARPNISDGDIDAELPLLKEVAFKVLKQWGKI